MPRRLGNLADRIKSVKPENTDGLLGLGAEQNLITEIPLAKIEAAPWNARRYFDEAKLQLLANSIKTSGLLQPILVRPVKNAYQLVVGERRYRAAKIAGLKSLRAHVRELTEKEARHLSLTENLEREDLSSYEEAAGIMELLIAELSDEAAFRAYRGKGEDAEAAIIRLLFKLQNEVMAAGKSYQVNREEKKSNGHVPITFRPPFDRLFELIFSVFDRHTKIAWNTYIRNRLPLLDLPTELRQALTQGHLDQSKARELARIQSNDARAELLNEVIREGLTSAEVKTRVRNLLQLPSEKVEFSSDLRIISRNLKKIDQLPSERRERIRVLIAEMRQLLEA